MTILKATEIAGAGKYPSKRLNQRERKVLQVSDQYSPANSADWGSNPPASVSGALDQIASSGAMKTVSVTYDFSVNGGDISSIPLSISLPNHAIIAEVIRDEVTPCTSSGSTGTIQLNVPTDGNLEQTALTADGGSPSLASSGGTAVPLKTTAARTLQVTIATSALTAGKIVYFVRYFDSI